MTETPLALAYRLLRKLLYERGVCTCGVKLPGVHHENCDLLKLYDWVEAERKDTSCLGGPD